MTMPMSSDQFGAKPAVLRCSRCGKFVDWEDAQLQIVADGGENAFTKREDFARGCIRSETRHRTFTHQTRGLTGLWNPRVNSALIPSWAAGRPSEAMHASHPAPSSTSEAIRMKFSRS